MNRWVPLALAAAGGALISGIVVAATFQATVVADLKSEVSALEQTLVLATNTHETCIVAIDGLEESLAAAGALQQSAQDLTDAFFATPGAGDATQLYRDVQTINIQMDQLLAAQAADTSPDTCEQGWDDVAPE